MLGCCSSCFGPGVEGLKSTGCFESDPEVLRGFSTSSCHCGRIILCHLFGQLFSIFHIAGWLAAPAGGG